MKKQLKKLSLSKKVVANLRKINGGRPPNTFNCGADPIGPPDEPLEWFTDAAERLCETFDGTGCF
ncbi:MAG: hypothetical protein AAF617_01700 [Bacteroidota bacterium]